MTDISEASRAGSSRQEVAEQLRQVQKELDRLTAIVSKFDPSVPTTTVSADWVSGILRARRRRVEFFGDIFSDPAWDFLLAMYAADLAGKSTTITDLCEAAAVPYTTGLRWEGELSELGLAVRKRDAEDKRQVFIELSAKGRAAMADFFAGDRLSEVAV